LILRRYLIREILLSFFAVFILLLLIYTSNRFVQYLSEAAAGNIGGDLIATLVGLKLIKALVLLVPLCLYLGIYIAVSRLRRDNEVTAMRGAGLGLRFFLQGVLQVAGGFAAVVSVLALYIAPEAEGQINWLEAKARKESDITGISAGQFKELSQGDRVVYVEDLNEDEHRMNNIFLQIREAGQLWVLTSAGASLEKDKETGEPYAVFSDGQRYMGTPGQLDYSIIEYKKYGVRLYPQGQEESDLAPQAASPEILWHATDPAAQAELHWRIAMPIATVLLALLAVLLALSLSQVYGYYSGLITAVLIYFTYNNLLGIGRSLVKKGELPGYIGLWWVHALLLACILGLIVYPALRRWWVSTIEARRRSPV
jgi:lipopolysaccharide export system permease protein